MAARDLPRDFGRRSAAERHDLRRTFGEIPELYERARPLYPPEIFADLTRLSDVPPGGRILEIGPGTGQATLPLAEAGFEIVAVELTPELASFVRRKLAGFGNVAIVNAPFESWVPTAERFDAVVAFTAFHWLDPEVRFSKPAELLRPRGSLAVVSTQHVLPADGDPFWSAVQEDYDAVDPRDDNTPPPLPDDVRDLSSEIDASGYFDAAAQRRYVWDVTYTADEYVALLDTYSGHRRLSPEQRDELYSRIRRRIEARPAATVAKTYLAILNVARKKGDVRTGATASRTSL